MSVPDETAIEQWLERHANRGGPGHAARRLALEAAKEQHLQSTRRWPYACEMQNWMNTALAVTGLCRPGLRNAQALELQHHRLIVPDLPPVFEGLRLLHISDPHFCEQQSLTDNLVAAVDGVAHDLCVLTGDYRYRSFGCNRLALDGLASLRRQLPAQALAILGNHDSIRTLPAMEALGYEVLLNEHQVLEREGAQLALIGVDDPAWYCLDDLPRALAGARHVKARILLAHAPDLAVRAAQAGVGAYLCGHTHGGQICLPGGVPIVSNTRAPRALHSGAWQVGRMHGYTSRGAGVSIAQVRFFCPPEITLHTLHRETDHDAEHADSAQSRVRRHGRQRNGCGAAYNTVDGDAGDTSASMA